MSVIITLPGGGGAQADWNATSGESQILNKPTLGTAAGADIEDFVAAATIANYETITQLNARDTANRNRANHTGTQLASTISDLGSAISANTDVAANTAARHVPVTVTNSGEIGLTLAGQNITASLVNGSIASARLDSAVNTSLSLANSSVQPGTLSNYETTTQLNARDTANRNRANHTGTQLAATISDIGFTISANTDVALNTAARHAAVTVTDSSEIDFTLTGQNITASLIDGSIGETRLSSGVNTSLGLANTALQPSTIGVTVQGYSAILAGITTQKITNWDTAYGWGNHATAGYLTTFTESDPVFGASPAAGITTQKITNWDTAYGWGNHATAGYETTTQLNARDTANRDRANHIGTQLASTISDLGSAISANTDVAANTAARHAAVTVTDSSEIDFTLTGQNITANLIDGSIGATRLDSAVNTSLSLANSSVQPGTLSNYETTTQLNARDTANRNRANHTGTQPWNTITGTPTTTAGYGITDAAFNGQIINGVAHFVQNAAPTTRIDAAGQNIGPLVNGDIWYNPSTGIFGTWRSPLWLGPVRYSSQENKGFSTLNTDKLFGFDRPSIVGTNNGNTALFIESCLFSQMPGSSTPFGDSSNYTLYRFGYSASTTSYTDLYTVQSNLLPSSGYAPLQYSYPINAVYNIMQFNCGFTTVGSPSSQSQSSIRMYYKYREVL